MKCDACSIEIVEAHYFSVGNELKSLCLSCCELLDSLWFKIDWDKEKECEVWCMQPFLTIKVDEATSSYCYNKRRDIKAALFDQFKKDKDKE